MLDVGVLHGKLVPIVVSFLQPYDGVSGSQPGLPLEFKQSQTSIVKMKALLSEPAQRNGIPKMAPRSARLQCFVPSPQHKSEDASMMPLSNGNRQRNFPLKIISGDPGVGRAGTLHSTMQ